MKRLRSLIVTIVLLPLLTSQSFGQREYFIGDIVQPEGNIETLRTNKNIEKPYAQFIERSFTIIVSKADLMHVIKQTTALFTKGERARIDMMNTIGGYLDTCSNLTFKHLWTKQENPFAWSDYKEVDIRRVTEAFLQERICSIIENGQFRILSKNEEMENYYHKETSTRYGIANCVFTGNNKMIWICPPIIVE